MVDNILILGNGFDLAMNRKTSYKDFLRFTQVLWMLYNAEYVFDIDTGDSPFKVPVVYDISDAEYADDNALIDCEKIEATIVDISDMVTKEIKDIFNNTGLNLLFMEEIHFSAIKDYLYSFSEYYYGKTEFNELFASLTDDIEENNSEQYFDKWFTDNFLVGKIDYKVLFDILPQKMTVKELENLMNIENNLVLDYILKNKNSLGNNWSNIELAISDLVLALNDLKMNLDSYAGKDIYFLRNITNEIWNFHTRENFPAYKYLAHHIRPNGDDTPAALYLTQLNEKIISDLDHITQLLEWYLAYLDKMDFEINKIERTQSVLDCVENIGNAKVLTFNYTNTAQKLLGVTLDSTHFIHGKINFNRPKTEINTMVFGIEDKEDDIETINLDLIPYQKFYQRTLKETGNEFEVFFQNPIPKNIIVFGHSVDPLDKEIFKKCFGLAKEGKYEYKFIFTYFDESAKRSIIKNLAAILGKNSLVELTSKKQVAFVKSDDIERMKKELLTD